MDVLWCFAKAMAIKIDMKPSEFFGSDRTKWWDKMLGPWLGWCFLFQHQMIYEHFPEKRAHVHWLKALQKYLDVDVDVAAAGNDADDF